MRFVLMPNDKWYCYGDDESPAHEEELKGLLHKCDDDFWRFQSHPDVMLTCKDCRQIAEKLSALNVL